MGASTIKLHLVMADQYVKEQELETSTIELDTMLCADKMTENASFREDFRSRAVALYKYAGGVDIIHSVYSDEFTATLFKVDRMGELLESRGNTAFSDGGSS